LFARRRFENASEQKSVRSWSKQPAAFGFAAWILLPFTLRDLDQLAALSGREGLLAPAVICMALIG
jgi:hypothetical protein